MENLVLYFLRLFRSAFRSKVFTGINILGLSIGLSISMFLLAYLQFEFSYDKHFKDADRIYRMLSGWDENGVQIMPLCFDDLGASLLREVPEVEATSRLYDMGEMNFSFRSDQKLGAGLFLVDSAFLQIFDFKVVYGQIGGNWNDWASCVITSKTAERFFGKGHNPVGEVLMLEGKTEGARIMAVIEDIPANTHFRFDVLMRLPDFGWDGLEYYTYLKFKAGIDQEKAIIKCNEVNEKMLRDGFGTQVNSEFYSFTEPLTGIHTSTKADFDLTPTASKSNLIFIIIVVIFLLGIVISNFISLYIIQGEKQSLEISIRKTNGASRIKIMKMIFREAFLVTFCAFLLSIVLYYGFSSLLMNWLNLHFPEGIGMNWSMWMEFLGLYIVLAFIVSCYPAYYLSKFSPAKLIHGAGVRKYKLTATSVVIQFSVVIFCISSLFFIWRQLDYVRKLPLGFETENILEVSTNIDYKNFSVLKSELLSYPYISEVAVGQGNPIAGCSGQFMRRMDQNSKEAITVSERRVGPGYFHLYDIPLLEGGDFKEYAGKKRSELIISESLVARLDLKDPIGKKVYFLGDEPWTIIGVAKDVIVSAHEKTEYRVYSAYTKDFYTLAVKFAPGKYQETKAEIFKIMDKYYKGIPVNLHLTTDLVQNQYWQDKVTARILITGTVLAVLLALLGLLALSGFVTKQKRKEIGMRRVLGAQIDEVVFSLHRYIVLRILPAIPVGIILSYCAMKKWMENFEYTSTLVWWVFVLGVVVTLLISILTVFYQTYKAATANPVDALKSE